MRRTLPVFFLCLFVIACGDTDDRTNTSKSNPQPGAIERHLSPPVNDVETNAPTAEAAPAVVAPEPAAARRVVVAPVEVPVERAAEPQIEQPTAQPSAQETTVAEVLADESIEPTEEPASSVQLVRVVIASAIESREPTGASPFTSDIERAFLFLETSNEGGPGTLSVRWVQPDGTALRPIDLEIPHSRRWRTWATTTRVGGRAGAWTAVVSDAEGRELARRSFVVAVAPSA